MIEAYFNSRFCLSQSRTSLKTYIDFKFCLSQSTTTLEAYVDLDFRISMLRASLDVNRQRQVQYGGDSGVVGYDIGKIKKGLDIV